MRRKRRNSASDDSSLESKRSQTSVVGNKKLPSSDNGFSKSMGNTILGDSSNDENGTKPNALTEFDTSKCKAALTQESNMADCTDSNVKWLTDSVGKESAERVNDQLSNCSTMKANGETISHYARALVARASVAGAHEVATSESLSLTGSKFFNAFFHHAGNTVQYEKKVKDQTSHVSPTQIDRQGHESDDGALVTGSDYIEEEQTGHSGHSLTELPVAPRHHEMDTLPRRAKSPANTEGLSDGKICEVSYPDDTNGVEGKNMGLNICRVDEDENASVESATNAPVVEPACDKILMSSIIPDEAVVHQPIIQSPMDADSPASSNNSQSPQSTVLMSIHFPETTRARETHSVGKIKMALFLEASNVHRGNGAERMFSKYWETIGEYITLGSKKVPTRVMPGLRSSRAGIESILRSFLRTRKMKRLHNKLILGKPRVEFCYSLLNITFICSI
jgi:hypothetical protein